MALLAGNRLQAQTRLPLSPAPRLFAGCNRVPEDVDPRSFRSVFAFNTNLWLLQKRSPLDRLWEPKGHASLFAPGEPLETWFAKDRAVGVGGRVCRFFPKDGVKGQDLRVWSRCPCDPKADPDCGSKTLLVRSLAAKRALAGTMPMDQLKKVAESGPKRAKGPIKMKVVEH